MTSKDLYRTIRNDIQHLNQKIDNLQSDLDLVKKSLDIRPDRSVQIRDIEEIIMRYEKYAKNNEPNQSTADNQESAVRKFLKFSGRVIDPDAVRTHLDSGNKNSWRANQTNTSKKHIEDHLSLGDLLNESSSTQEETRTKKIPSIDESVRFFTSVLTLISNILSRVF